MTVPSPCPSCLAPREPGESCPNGCRSEAVRAKAAKTRRRYGPVYRRIKRALVASPLPCVWQLPGCTGTATTPDHEGGQLVPACAACNNARAQAAAAIARGITYVRGL